MSLVAAAVAAGLLARAAAGPSGPVPGSMGLAGDVGASADHFTYDVVSGRVLLEGNVVIRRGGVVLRARSATWDPPTGEVRASGGVLLTDATRVISADAIRAVLDGDVEAEGVLAFVKDRPADLSGVRSMEEAARAGRNRLTFSGERLRGTPDGHVKLTGARLTLCDCPGGGAPSWEVTAREADVVPGKRAILRGSAVRVVGHPVPLLALPWLYVPLADRQSGLLLPTFSSTGASGFSIAEPVFVTLGRSADATITPQYAFGRSSGDVAAGKPAMRGPGAHLELRWAPAETSGGIMDLAWLHDLDAEPGGESGDRWGLSVFHGQRLRERTTLAAELRLVGDPVWVRDNTTDVLRQSAPYRRSDVLASHRRGPVVAEAVASYIQPTFQTVPAEPYGFLGSDIDFSSRFGSATAAIVPYPVGPLRISGRAGAARFAPVGGGVDRVLRPAATRADARAEVALPLLVGGAFTVAPFLRGAALGYAFDEARDPGASAWGVAGATVATEVSRRYGALHHAVAPRLEWRAGTRAGGEVLPFAAYDAFDRSTGGALPSTPESFHQLRAAVETRLRSRGTDLLRAELGQDVDLRDGRLAETFASLAGGAGPVRAGVNVSFFPGGRNIPAPPPSQPRIPSPLDDLTELGASLSVQDRRGDSVRAGFFSVGPGGSGRLVVGIDPLFDVRPATVAAAAGASAGVTAALATAKLSYDATFFGRDTFATCPNQAERRYDAVDLQQQTGTVFWESSCRCFRIVLVGSLDYCGSRSYHVSFELSRLTSAMAR